MSKKCVTSMLYQAVMGPPAICVVFDVPDEDEAQPEDITAQKEELQMVLQSQIYIGVPKIMFACDRLSADSGL
jgi:hypothetical protein